VSSEKRHRHASTGASDVWPLPEAGHPEQHPAPSDQEVDRALVQRVAARDEAALAGLYDRYSAQVNGLALSLLRDFAMAEEVTHDVFLRVWERPAAYDPARGTFAGWLFRVTRNRAIDQLRRRRETSLGDLEAEAGAWIADPQPTPEEQTLRGLRRLEVLSALDTLPADQRRLLEMAYYSGLSQREIAERLERPLGTVKSQIRSAMRRLADRLVAADAPPIERT
jgi:RNA polymerase sigma-70 factor (ECF subfamily)